MGYYIETGSPLNKAEWLIINEGAMELSFAPETLKDLPPGPELDGLICVVNNGCFEAAAFVYDDSELRRINDPSDYRQKRWLVLPSERAKELSGYTE